MPRVRQSTLAFDAITLEGSLLSPAKLAEIAERNASDQSDADYRIPKGVTLRDEMARYFRIGQALFRDLHASPHSSLAKTIRFTEELLRDVFGFLALERIAEPRIRDGRTFPITLEALGGRVQIVVVPPPGAHDQPDDLDHASPSLSQDRRRSAASALQDWLNADDGALWGLATNGEALRLLRDNESLTRPAYLEADLRQIFDSEDFAGFSALWLVLHASRFGQPDKPVTDCPLERWREAGAREGVTARDRLRDGVEAALLALGTGFLAHPDNAELAASLREGRWPLDAYFSQLLRLVYRLIFLFAAEDRDLLHPPGTSDSARKLYKLGYSLGTLRDRAIQRSGWDSYHDRWDGLRVTLRALANGEPRLGLPALGGLFAADQTRELDAARLSNRALMEAIFRLAWLRADGLLMPVNWRDMETEELGSVYESLLELTPRLSADGREFLFAEGTQTKGNARKTTGSYYTPDSLVQALLDSALDPVLDRIESEAEDPVAGLLGVTVIDPACGSGHFLLAAARRIATRVARLRADGVPSAADYRHALRDVVRSSIHGVDRNPMAVELTRVALWIETVEPGKPLGFLDANIRRGDSLLGIFSLPALAEGIPDAAYKPLTRDDKLIAKEFARKNKADKGERTASLDFSGEGAKPFALPPLATSLRAVRTLPEDTVDQVAEKRGRFEASRHERRMGFLSEAADLYIAAFLTPKTKDTAGQGGDTALIPTTTDVLNRAGGHQVYGPRLGHATQLARAARAFHWPLEFPDIMNAGGFDVVLGNPPWEVMQLSEEEYFAFRVPEIAELAGAARKRAIVELGRGRPEIFAAYETEKRRFEANNEFARESGRFETTAQGKINTFALFADLSKELLGNDGYTGIIVPTGIATDATTAEFFAALVKGRQLARIVSFENEDSIFPAIHHAYRFCLLLMSRQPVVESTFSFFLRRVDQMTDPDRSFCLSQAVISLINPNTNTAPVFRSRFDAELTVRIYSRVPAMIVDGVSSGNPWEIQFRQGLFNMTSDSALFRTADELMAADYQMEGSNWTLDHRFEQHQQRPERYVPLYEAKMVHQYDHRWANYSGIEAADSTLEQHRNKDFEPGSRYWVPEGEVHARLLNRGWNRDWLMGWRAISGIEKIRTIISAAIPAVGVGHTFLLFLPSSSPKLTTALYACLNSIVGDYIARQKVGGTALTNFILKQLAILPPDCYTDDSLTFIIPRVLELTYTSHSMAPFARDLGYDGPPFPWDEDRRALLRAELDAWYARAYGLTRDELRYILDPADVMGPDYPSETFRVLKNNELRKFGEYRTQRLVLDAWDRMERGDLPKPEPYQRESAGAPRLDSETWDGSGARLGGNNKNKSVIPSAGGRKANAAVEGPASLFPENRDDNE